MPAVLVVDDNARNLRFLHDALDAHGYTIHTASSGKDALEQAERMAPDLVLLDVQMPGMSGTEVMRRLKKGAKLRGVPVVAVTALAMKGDEVQLLDSGFDGYISKPVAIREMLDILDAFLNPVTTQDRPTGGQADMEKPPALDES